MKTPFTAFILILTLLPTMLYGAEEAGTAEPELSDVEAALNGIKDREEKIEIVPTHAYFGKKKFFIRLLAGDYPLYSSGSYPEPEEEKTGYDPGSYVLQLNEVQVEEWEDLPDDVMEVPILPREKWLSVMNSFREKITPKDRRKGIVVEFLHEREYFLYFDSKGDLQATFLEDKPPDFGVSATYSEKEITQMRLEHLRSALDAGDLPGPVFLVRLPERGAFSYPFVAANLESGIVAYIQYISDEDIADAIYGGPSFRSITHLAVPSFLGMIVRPFTALHQLLTLPVDSIQDTVMPNSLKRIPEDEPLPDLYEGPGMNLVEFEKQLDELTKTQSSMGTIDYLIDGKNFYPRFIDAFHKAEESIDLRTYIFDNDDYAHKVAGVLKDKADEGVRVRVLLDGTPTITHQKPKQEKLPEGFVPPSTIYGYMEEDSDVRVRLRPNTWLSLDHSKTTIIDEKFAFLGGMNIGKEYRYHWHDMMMEIRGPVVGELQYRFDRAWAISGWAGDLASAIVQSSKKPEVSPTGKDYPIRVLLSRQGDSDIYWAQLAAIDNAKKYIYIENAYFADNHILYRLVKARRRGVDVRVILPRKGNWGAMNASNLVTANRMFTHGIRVYLYPGMSHIKAAVYDGWACIGSANFDRASFRLNVETNIATSYEPKVQEIIDTLFLPDFEESEEMTELFPETWQHRFMEAIANQM